MSNRHTAQSLQGEKPRMNLMPCAALPPANKQLSMEVVRPVDWRSVLWSQTCGSRAPNEIRTNASRTSISPRGKIKDIMRCRAETGAYGMRRYKGEFGRRVLATERKYAPRTKNRSSKGIEEQEYLRLGVALAEEEMGEDQVGAKDIQKYGGYTANGAAWNITGATFKCQMKSQKKECGDSEEGSAALCVEIGGAGQLSNDKKGRTVGTQRQTAASREAGTLGVLGLACCMYNNTSTDPRITFIGNPESILANLLDGKFKLSTPFDFTTPNSVPNALVNFQGALERLYASYLWNVNRLCGSTSVNHIQTYSEQCSHGYIRFDSLFHPVQLEISGPGFALIVVMWPAIVSLVSCVLMWAIVWSLLHPVTGGGKEMQHYGLLDSARLLGSGSRIPEVVVAEAVTLQRNRNAERGLFAGLVDETGDIH
ncbi:hypothetical protein B0H13DRAFT_2562182 [Mycena leptocephala]|nr:hypothetical protein B0H13DRAFT_2562182 [Mycena leptocephala]